MKLKAFALALAAAASFVIPSEPASAALPAMKIVTPAYTLECASHAQGKRLVLDCVPKRTSKEAARGAFGAWRYGDPLPKAMFVDQPLGNGGPALQCADSTLTCTGGYSAALNLANANTWSATQTFSAIADTGVSASSLLCTDASKNVSTACGSLSATVASLVDSGLAASAGVVCTDSAHTLTTTGCSAGGGDTITTPNSSLSVGGTSTATTLDINLAHTNSYTVFQCLAGTGGANACAGTNFPGGVYGIVAGANNGANQGAIIIGPASTDFNCTASCTAGDSERIRFFSSLSTGAVNGCDQYINTALSQKPMYFACPLSAGGAVSGKATNAGTTYLPPIYTTTAGAVANTLHGVFFTCAFSAATTCAVTISGTGNTFVSGTSYWCGVDMGTATTNIQFTVGNKTTSGFTVYAGTSNSDTVAGLCIGT